ncbi:transcription factor TFIIIB subunit brf1 [Blyttiomyces sp. JEL0837]|nr:transcription factor TFIIIB subunit brf1 [Blyttiomyces sp. JEL0837]
MNNPKTCCGAANIEHDVHHGHSVCRACGRVLEENAIVSEVTFSESSGGAAVADGVYVNFNKARASTKNRIGIRGNGVESREQTIANGHRRIQLIGNQMKMTDRQIEAAQRYFNLAVVENFTKGRKANSVASACLYIVCRLEQTSLMLIDFAENLRINVYVLGATFIRLVATLKLFDIPLVDPMLYIARFAAKLEFEDKLQSVVRDASRLVTRMDRDWIVKGRRPAGICAACLYISARMNGFKRTLKEIVTVVKICETTLRKRLDDFKATPSSELSVEDFQTLMLEEAADPPSFGDDKKKKRKLITDGEDDDEDGDTRELTFDVQEALSSKELRAYLSEAEKTSSLSNHIDSIDVEGEHSILDTDAEVKNAILTDAEVQIKKMFWEADNRDWEINQKSRDNDKANKANKKPRKKKEQSSMPSAATPYEAGMNLLASKPLSKKINYSMMENLFLDDPLQKPEDDDSIGFGGPSVTGFGKSFSG